MRGVGRGPPRVSTWFPGTFWGTSCFLLELRKEPSRSWSPPVCLWVCEEAGGHSLLWPPLRDLSVDSPLDLELSLGSPEEGGVPLGGRDCRKTCLDQPPSLGMIRDRVVVFLDFLWPHGTLYPKWLCFSTRPHCPGFASFSFLPQPSAENT